mmetsp:Transcript_135742/g.201880  ORF Transcript_135742/g.201880 Transcript_135742/m.201880 type:complete len:84 (+) Transcript_135742:146-397(+)
MDIADPASLLQPREENRMSDRLHGGLVPESLGDSAWKQAMSVPDSGVRFDDFTNEDVIRRVGQERAEYRRRGEPCSCLNCTVQ